MTKMMNSGKNSSRWLLVYFAGLIFCQPLLINTQWCSKRPEPSCCPGRFDECTAPISDTLCYCDLFCNRTITDCCPDFWGHCLGIEPPEGAWTVEPPTKPSPNIENRCIFEGKRYQPGEKIKNNCDDCTCVPQSGGNEYKWECSNRVCLIRPELMDKINRDTYGWRAGNYSFLWGLTLDEGIKYRLGTEPPQSDTASMSSLRVHINEILPESFDARKKWAGMIHPVRDQGNCASSWAISTADTASDRLSIHSHGGIKDTLSAQNLISCNTKRQEGCQGGHLDRAWWYLRKKGVVSDSCYQYTSGSTDQIGQCMMPRTSKNVNRFKRSVHLRCPSTGRMTNDMYSCTPPYRIAQTQREIMKEIVTNGPVQATFVVPEDFYMYKTGVYKHAKLVESEPEESRKRAYHSARIIGWGTDRSQDTNNPIPYWLAVNSWGPAWGEQGTFKILRGSNECEVESFIVGVWGKVNGKQMNHLRKLRRHRRH